MQALLNMKFEFETFHNHEHWMNGNGRRNLKLSYRLSLKIFGLISTICKSPFVEIIK